MEIIYKFRKRLTVTVEQRDRHSPMGRFGGGWNWQLGFELGSRSLILNLLVFSIRFEVDRKVGQSTKLGN